ncbi:cytochrome P450 [Nitzschia inconspicua]|uniref:Cytochrome P450 n=1 Tax=Nitzschia inconspicua TaxID=303405 RepID=A0A9K3M796_9STRA|nr:cytochrome P450 [Nitzschia inconspicua]
MTSALGFEIPSDPTMWIVTVLAGVAIFFTYNFLFAFGPDKTKDGLSFPPEPPGKHWLWGHAPLLPNDGTHFDLKFLEMAQQMNNASVFTVQLPIFKRMIIVADPDIIHHITVSKNYHKSWTYKFLIFGPQSIVRTHGDEWLVQRKTFVFGFTPTYLKDMVTTMCSKLERYLKVLDQDATNARTPASDMLHRAQIFTSDVIVQVALGEDWGDSYDEKSDFLENIGNPYLAGFGNKQTSKLMEARSWLNEMAFLSNALMSHPLTYIFGFAERQRLKELTKQVNELFGDVLERRLNEFKTDEGKMDVPAGKDICSLAIATMKKGSGGKTFSLTPEEKINVIEQLKTFYFAGNDTTATTIAWASWLLSQHPEVMTKLRKELDQKNIFKGFKNDNAIEGLAKNGPTYDQLNDCPYLDAVIKETLRLYPPASTGRYVADPEESYNNQYKLGGAVLYVNPFIMHRLPQYWENPNDFQPDRFVGLTSDMYSHKFLPFSKGKRDCLGKYFAMIEAKLAVAALVQRYDMTCYDEKETVGTRITSYPIGGAKVYLTLRSSSGK